MAATHSKPVRRKSTVGLDNLEWVVAFYMRTICSVITKQEVPVMRALFSYLGKVLFGAFMGVMLICIGSVLTLTVIGGIIGVPLAIFGAIQLILSPLTGALMTFRKCPYCGNTLMVARWKESMKCSKCKKRIISRDGMLEVVQ